jgi:hypothetical protein
VSPEIAEGPKDAEGFLHAEEAIEGPFPVELDDGLVMGDTVLGYDVLAGVIAFARACPKE